MLLLALAFFGCSEEREYLENQPSKIAVRKISFDEFSNNAHAMRTFTAIKDKQESRKNGRIIYDPVSDFYIDTDDIIVAEKDGHFYYTFLIRRDSISSKTENLVLKEDENGAFTPLIFEYLFSESDKTNIKYGNPVANLDDKTVIKKPEELGLEGVTETVGKYTQCVKVFVAICKEDNHEDGAYPDGSPCPANGSDFFWYCFEGGGGFSDTGDGLIPPTDGPIDAGSGGGESGGGPGAVSPQPNNCSHCNEVITMPMIDVERDDPCDKLKNVFASSDPANPAVLSPNLRDLIVTQMRPNISVNPDGEKAFVVNRTFRGQFNVIDQGTSTDTQINITLPRMVFMAIHTHPNSTYPMFSWSDLLVLYNMNKIANQFAPWNVGMASFLLVCKDHLGNDLTYAIVYNDETNDMIQSTLSSPEFAGLDEKQIGEEMNLLLGDKYKMEQNFDDCNFERAFLSQLTGSNISLYKADSGLTGWSQLEINSANNTVNEIPCN